jgi:hypothetical protein
MNTSTCKGQRLGGKRWLAHVMVWSMCLGFWCEVCRVGWADSSLPEYQVKALYLFNFTKYVDWPTNAFAASNTPIIIGLYGESKLGEALTSVVAGKTIGGRTIAVRVIESMDDSIPCHILFISDAESSRMHQILDKIGALPTLTVGEDAAFTQNGGIINFVLKNGNVRLEINLSAAKKAGLTISSRLLAVADVVKGKAN